MSANHVYPQHAQTLSPETCKKLSRARTMANFTYLHLYTCADVDSVATSPLYLSYLFSYISDDLSAVREELRQRGLLPD